MQNGDIVLVHLKNRLEPILSVLQEKEKFVCNEFIDEKSYLIAVSKDNLRQKEVVSIQNFEKMNMKITEFSSKYAEHLGKIYKICNTNNIQLSWLGILQATLMVVKNPQSNEKDIIGFCEKIHLFQEETLPELKDPFQ